MRAVRCKEFGPPEALVVEEVDEPVAGPGEVVVDVRVCGVNFPDVLMIQNRYQYKPELPFTPGGEVAGVVSALGEGVTGLQIGDRVVTGALNGGLAEKVAVPAGAAAAVPDGVDLVPASTLRYAYGTSYHALVDRGSLRRGETLLVLGAAGGVGLAAVELGAALGATVIAAASSEEKLALCRDRGATETIDYEREDLKARVRELTGGAGADVVYDAVGGPYAEPALRSTAWDGRFLVVGFAAGDIPRIPLNLPLLKNCSIVGVFFGAWAGREPQRAQANMARLIEMLEAGTISPHVSATYPLEETGRALRDLLERRAKGKIVVEVAAAG